MFQLICKQKNIFKEDTKISQKMQNNKIVEYRKASYRMRKSSLL